MRKAGIDRDDMKREEKRPDLKMRAKKNWENMGEPTDGTISDRLHIDPDLIPEGMAAQWVTDSVYGQPQTYHRSGFEKNGWTPVHGEDFDGQFDGMFQPKGTDGEIRVDGMVLMMRPQELSDRAKRADRKKAQDGLQRAHAMTEGVPGITMGGADHPSALRTNRINTSMERIKISED